MGLSDLLAMARSRPSLPEIGSPGARIKPRWATSWTKGGEWARAQLVRVSAVDLSPDDRSMLEENLLGSAVARGGPPRVSNLGVLESKLSSYAAKIRPHRIAEAARLRDAADRKMETPLSTDQRAFWDGVYDYAVKVLGAWSEDSLSAEAFYGEVEAEMVRSWRLSR